MKNKIIYLFLKSDKIKLSVTMKTGQIQLIYIF